VSPPGVRGGGAGSSERYSFLGLGKEKKQSAPLINRHPEFRTLVQLTKTLTTVL
jgi:hypothetical protein